MSISITVQDNASKTLKEYLTYSKRSVEEACNQHLYFALRNAVNETYAPSKDKIKSDLMSESKTQAPAPVAAIIINSERGKKGQKGLSGRAMKTAVENLIKKRQAHRNFARSNWLPAIKILASIVPKKGGKSIPSNTDLPGRIFGGVKPARQSVTELKPFALAWNSVLDKIPSGKTEKVRQYLEAGAEKGLKMEIESMKKYIERKMEEAKQKFWR